MVSTYVAIAEGWPDSEVHRANSWTGCRSSLAHPVANFAILHEGGASAEFEAMDYLAGRPHACLYSVSEGRPSSTLPLCGGRCLKLMVAEAQTTVPNGVDLVLAASDAERRLVADFMVSQFFGAHVEPVRRILAMASASGNAPLYWLSQLGKRVGAVTLNADAGALGIYNFCIDSRLRGRGLGSMALNAIARFACAAGLSLTLQCSPNLVSFYSRHNYEIVGHVDIWSLERKKSAVIMRGR